MRTLLGVLGTLFVLGGNSSAAIAQSSRPQPGRVLRDTLTDGTTVRFVEPTTWNGAVVIDAFGASDVFKDLLAVLVGRGYAAVTPFLPSGYRNLRDKTAQVTLLRRDIARRFGPEARVYVIGQSEGAYRVLAELERHPADYRGGVAFCPLAQTEMDLPEPILDLVVAFDFYFPGVLTGGGRTLAQISAPGDRLSSQLTFALGANPTRAAELARRFSIETVDLAGVVEYYAFIMWDLQQGAGGNPFDISQRRFPRLADDTAFNQNVRRFTADSAAARRAQAQFQVLSGRLSAPALIVENSYDPVLPPPHVAKYVALVASVGAGDRVVVSDVAGAGHCNFTLGDRVEAVDQLVAWAERGTRPRGGTLAPKPVPSPGFPTRPSSEIDGTWQHSRAPLVTMSATEGTVTLANNGRVFRTSGFVIDPLVTPKGVDIIDILGERTLGIYDISGDVLRFAEFTDPNRSLVERPREFSGPGVTVNTYRRSR